MYEDTMESGSLMVGRFDTVGRHYWSLACNLSELAAAVCLLHVEGEVSVMQDLGFARRDAKILTFGIWASWSADYGRTCVTRTVSLRPPDKLRPANKTDPLCQFHGNNVASSSCNLNSLTSTVDSE